MTYHTSCTRAPSVSFADELAGLPCAEKMHRTVQTIDNVPEVAPPPDTTPVILPPPEPPPMDMLSMTVFWRRIRLRSLDALLRMMSWTQCLDGPGKRQHMHRVSSSQ